MRDKLLFQDWERLEKDDLNTMEELCSGGLGKAIEAIAKPVKEWLKLPIYRGLLNALRFARGCIVKDGTCSLNIVSKTLTISGSWRFVFADPDIDGAKGQIVDWSGTIEIDNAYEENKVTLIMAKPIWETVQEERQVGDPGTGLFSKQAIEKRYRFTSLAFQVVDVTSGEFLTDSIEDHQKEGYHFFAVTYTSGGTGTVELCYVFPPVLDALGSKPYPNLSVQSALWALAGAVKLLRDGQVIEKPYDAKDIATPLTDYDKANVAALHERVTPLEEMTPVFAATLVKDTNTPVEDGYNIASGASWQQSSATWTVTYTGSRPKRIVVQPQRAEENTPYLLADMRHDPDAKKVYVQLLNWDTNLPGGPGWMPSTQTDAAKVYLLGLGVKE
jgi:hypothetical protein